MTVQAHTRKREVEIWAYIVVVYLSLWLAAFGFAFYTKADFPIFLVLGAALGVWLIFTAASLLVVHYRDKKEARKR
jgi:heme O synthase-like polyprenyltransferase